MPLKQRLIERITLEGPMTVADYMMACLFDPKDGYYSTRPAIGADGDFITAPMISQMFGEMIGVWVAQVWQNMGSPTAFTLLEIGGGDGTLMNDVLRVVERVPGLKDAARVVMVEASEPLRALQAKAIATACFVASLRDVTHDLPMIAFANEVLDCLPARQFVQTDKGRHERCVGVADGALTFGLVPAPEDFSPPFDALLGEIVEISSAQVGFARQLAALIKSASGAALLIDYGRDAPGPGDTLQALSHHEKRDPLEDPGDHDLTVWADFPAVAAAAHEQGVTTTPILSQGAFLKRLGINARLAALQAKNPDQADKLQRQYDRLVAPDQMGELFKVLGFASSPIIALRGLEAVTRDS